MSVLDRDANEWLEHWRSMSDAELTEERFRLYDAAEGLDFDSDLRAFAGAALTVIARIERQREARQLIREAAQIQLAGLDADVFTDALIAIDRLRRQLGSAPDAAGVLEGAIEVAETRKDQHEQ